MKLELKHIAGYLPYKMNGLFVYPNGDAEKCILGITNGGSVRDGLVSINTFLNSTYPAKPILRPFSDLTKEIEVNGEKFVPLEKLNEHPQTKHYIDKWGEEYVLLVDYEKGYNATYNMTAKDLLYEWHFDIHGLIEKNLAISIHDAR